jgi:ketoreductase RED1
MHHSHQRAMCVAVVGAGDGGEGMARFPERSGAMMENVWRGLGRVDLDDQTRTRLRKQSDDCYANVPMDDLIKDRDEEQIAILKVLRKRK